MKKTTCDQCGSKINPASTSTSADRCVVVSGWPEKNYADNPREKHFCNPNCFWAWIENNFIKYFWKGFKEARK